MDRIADALMDVLILMTAFELMRLAVRVEKLEAQISGKEEK